MSRRAQLLWLTAGKTAFFVTNKIKNMKSTTIGLIAGIATAVAGFLIAPQYAENPLFDEKTTGVILNVLGLVGVVITAISAYKASQGGNNTPAV